MWSEMGTVKKTIKKYMVTVPLVASLNRSNRRQPLMWSQIYSVTTDTVNAL